MELVKFLKKMMHAPPPKEEAKKPHHKEEKKEKPDPAQAIIDKFDKNHDGRVSKSEYLSAMK